MSFNFLKKSSSANGTNVLFLRICHLFGFFARVKFYNGLLKFPLTAKGMNVFGTVRIKHGLRTADWV